MSYIYEIWIGDYFYQGSTNNIKNRIRQHLQALNKNKHINPKMQAVWNKYQSFEHQILVECDDISVLIYEQDYINANWGDPKYLNLAPIAGKAPGKRGPMSEEHRAKISAAMKGKQNTLGKKATDETKAKMSASGKKKIFTDEHKANISIAKRAKR